MQLDGSGVELGEARCSVASMIEGLVRHLTRRDAPSAGAAGHLVVRSGAAAGGATSIEVLQAADTPKDEGPLATSHRQQLLRIVLPLEVQRLIGGLMRHFVGAPIRLLAGREFRVAEVEELDDADDDGAGGGSGSGSGAGASGRRRDEALPSSEREARHSRFWPLRWGGDKRRSGGGNSHFNRQCDDAPPTPKRPRGEHDAEPTQQLSRGRMREWATGVRALVSRKRVRCP